MLIYISVLSFVVSGLLFAILIGNHFITKKRKHPFERDIERRRKEAKGSKSPLGEATNYLFFLYLKIPIIKTLLFNLQQSLSLVGEKEQQFLRKKAVNILNSMFVVYILLTSFFYNITHNIFYTLVFICFLWYVADSYMDYFITKSHNRLLEQFLRFISLVRQKYYEYQVVDDSIYEATQALNIEDREMAVQGEIIYDMFMASDKESCLEKYLEIAPNAFLKMFVNFSQMTLEYGDQKVNGQSVYLMNLSFLSKNIHLEIDKRNRLNYALKSMNIIVMLPLFFISPLREWSINNFAPLGNFYASPMGKYTEILTILIILTSMVLLNKVANIEKNRVSEHRLKEFLDKIHLPLDHKQKKKWFYSFMTFCLSLIVILSIQGGARNQLRTKIYYQDQFLGATLSEEERDIRLQESIDEFAFVKENAQLIKKNKDVDIQKNTEISEKNTEVSEKNTELSEKNTEVVKEEPLVLDERIEVFLGDETSDERIERIKEKIDLYNTYYFSWVQLLISIGFGLLAYYIPEFNQYLTTKMQALDIDDEVAGFRSIIMMLMYHPRMNVEEIIEWLEGYALFYKETLHRCLLNVMSGEQEAVLDMLSGVKHKEMQRLIQQLAMATEDIGLEEAFDELIQEKANFFEQRKWQNEKLINRKIMIGQNIGFLPSYSLIILYMIVPMIITSSNELTRFFEHML